MVRNYEGGGISEKQRLVEELREDYTVTALYRGIGISKNKYYVYLMREMGLRFRIRCKYRNNRVWNIGDRVVKNLLEREFLAEKTNQKWVTDITQYRVGEVWLCFSAIKDLYNNASMESFFSHLKTEELYPYDIRSIEEAQMRIKEFIVFYNHRRPPRKLTKLTPVLYRNRLVG